VSISYVARRVGFFTFVVWLAATVIFTIVHLAPGDPISYQVGRMAAQGQGVQGGAALIAQYKRQFGLDKSLWHQYTAYMTQLAHFNLGYSIADFPTKTTTLIGQALPWTLGLLFTTIVISFVLGSLLGGLMAWRTTPGFVRSLLPGLMAFAAVPYYIIALGLLYVFAYRTQLLPPNGSRGVLDHSTGLAAVPDILRHSLLPGLSIVLAVTGFWMLGTRSTMISVLGSDYLLLAEAKGLSDRRVFLRYAMRTALVPQITVLAVWIGGVLSGAILVETVFSYPGLGELLVTSINGRDYPVIEAVGLAIVISTAGALLVLDLLYPLLDPRVRYERHA
jgi:peptide/nickel transport system permease protein